MKNIKDITISIFAIIGFVALLSSFNNQSHDTVPESHIWEMNISSDNDGMFMFNKVTGEVRKYENNYLIDSKNSGAYVVTYEISPKK